MTKTNYELEYVTWLDESDKLKSNVVYLLTFNDNGKEMYYVGSTSRQLRRRIYEHIKKNNNTLIWKTINRLKRTIVSILCECSSEEELKIKEEYYTLQYRSNEIEFGYNLHVVSKWSNMERSKKSEFMRSDKNVFKGKKHNEQRRRRNGETHSTRCKSIPDNIIFDSLISCENYYRNLFSPIAIKNYLDNGKIHKKSGQTFIRLID